MAAALPESLGTFAAAVAALGPLDAAAEREAAELHDRLTKPRGALGRLESMGIRLAAMAGVSPPPVPHPATVAVFAGDHGVIAQGVTPWPQEVTAQMVANLSSGGAAINVLARHAGARVVVVDVGVAGDPGTAPGLVRRNVRRGTADLALGPAMTLDEARRALDIGVEVASEALAAGARMLVTGDMGIGNTTPSAALIASFTGRPAAQVTGRGTGIDDATWEHKVAVVERALERHARDAGPDHDAGPDGDAGPDRGATDLRAALVALASLGGLEIAAIAGFVVAGAAARVPVVVDGVIALAALEAAVALAPAALPYCIAGHRSTEPGATAVLEHLGLDPVLDLGLRLGEGTGGCLAVPVVQAAAKILGEMATFDAAGVTDKV